ncbi:MAG TPA: peptidoglycan DD-metalloendopeptidase family protein [Acidimicrobiales bacterium]
MNGWRRRAAVLPLALVFVVAGLVPTGLLPAFGQSASEQQRIEDQIRSARSQVQEASAEEAKLLGELDAATARKRELDGKVAAIDGQIGGVQRSLNSAQGRLAAAEAEQRGAEERLATAQAQLEEAKRKLRAYAVAAYTGQSEATQFIQTTLKSGSMDELVAKRSYMKVVANTQTEAISTDERLRDEVKDLSQELSKAKEAAAAERDSVAAERAKLQEARDAQAVVQAEVATEVAKIDSLHGVAQARKTEFAAEVDRLEQESANIEAALRRRAEEQAAAARAAAAAAAPASPSSPSGSAAPGGSGTGAAAPTPAAPAASAGAGGLANPLPGAPITSPFGYRVHPIYGDSRLHTGVDMGASEGTPIRAAGAGVVVSAGWNSGGYGNLTIVDHGNGITTLYAHQSAFVVSANGRVSQGQVIGRVGCTGSCTGAHLHFEVRQNGTPVNPMNYI